METKPHKKILVVLFSLCFSSILFSNPIEEITATDYFVFNAVKKEDFYELFRKSRMPDFKPNACDDIGMTPLHHAAKNGNLAMVMFLAGAGADFTIRDLAGCTPVSYVRKDLELSCFFENFYVSCSQPRLSESDRRKLIQAKFVSQGEMSKLLDDATKALKVADWEALNYYNLNKIIYLKKMIKYEFADAIRQSYWHRAAFFWGMGFEMDEEGIRVFLGKLTKTEQQRKKCNSDGESLLSGAEFEDSYVDSDVASDQDELRNKAPRKRRQSFVDSEASRLWEYGMNKKKTGSRLERLMKRL